MKKFTAFAFLLVSTLIISGCCSDCKKECQEKPVKCDLSCVTGKTACKQPCAAVKNSGKCQLLGNWEFFIAEGDKLSPLPVFPQPVIELCKNGLLRFHYTKNDKPLTVEGKWKVENGNILIGDKNWTAVQSYTIKAKGFAETTVKNDPHLPANTRVVIRKK